MELALMSFANQMDALATSASCQQQGSNLTPQQYHLLQILQMDCHTKSASQIKSSAPLSWNADTYIKRALQDHLAQANMYQPWSATEANTIMADMADKLKALVETYRTQLPPA